MSYNYGAPPGFDPNSGPPGMRPPPGMAAPPGMASSPPGMPNANFQPPPNMPANFNFNAPVLRFGVDAPKPEAPAHRPEGVRGSNATPLRQSRMGLGAERGEHAGRDLNAQRQAIREGMAATTPPTREEVARTIFIGGLSEGAPDDEKMEDILRCAGKLRRWTRARDADDRKCKFGFAEYEDVGSLEAANEILSPSIEVPVFGKNGAIVKEEDSEENKKMRLLIVVDEQSKKYIDEWKGKQKEEDDARQFRMDGCREELMSCLTSMQNEGAFAANALNGGLNGDVDGDVAMGDANATNPDIVHIAPGLEDDLSDIPAEMRATVASEIRAFRDRSNRRDLERLRQEEDMAPRTSRLASPPPGASGTNGIPVGPRDRSGVQGAPSGPRGFRGSQMPNDYANGVNFVSANGTNGTHIKREDEDADESDDELERRRTAKRDADLEQQYAEAERRWLARERHRGDAQRRQKDQEADAKREEERIKDAFATRYAEWDDDKEARRGQEEYYSDRSAWLRARAGFRENEQHMDDLDRRAEEREKLDDRRREAEAKGMADDFLNQMDVDIGGSSNRSAEPQRPEQRALPGFKISLGSAAQRAAAKPVPRARAMADVENLLEDEDDADNNTTERLQLRPLTDTSTVPATSDMTDAEKADARRAIAASIPSSADELFAYPVKFNYLTQSVLDEQIKPFVEKKVVESLGVQEELLVDAVVEALGQRKGARDVVGELEDALGEEAEGLVRKVWRMVVFLTECVGRGLE